MQYGWAAISSAFLLASCAQTATAPITWPTDGWTVVTSEARGMDRTRLAALDPRFALDSVLKAVKSRP